MLKSRPKPIRLLLCEDDLYLSHILSDFLCQRGYSVHAESDGERGLAAFKSELFDVCVFDVNMPRKNGFELLCDVRQVDQHIPVVMLTARSIKEDVLYGFSLGCDDYVTKPFSMEELLCRLQSLLRRCNYQPRMEQRMFALGRYTFCPERRVLALGSSERVLTSKENELLTLLCDNMNKVLERAYALRVIWSESNYFSARSMDVYIVRLRRYLREDPSVIITNEHGKGYRLSVVPTE